MKHAITVAAALCAVVSISSCGDKKESPAKGKDPASISAAPGDLNAAGSAIANAAKTAADQAGAAGSAALAAGSAALAAGSAAVDNAASAVGSAAAALDDTTPLTAEQYEASLLALASCEVKESRIDDACPAYVAWQAARNRTQTLTDLAGLTSDLGKKHMANAAAAVRLQAAQLMASIFGADSGSRALIVEAARKEVDAGVLRSMLETVGSSGGSDAEIGKLLIEMADHADAKVRAKAVGWLASSWNNGVAGSSEKLADRIDNDTDMEVRTTACRYSGARGDDKLVATYEKHTKDPAANPELYAACFEGLVGAWFNYPHFDTFSKKAYELTLKRLGAKPRSKTAPPWGVPGEFEHLAIKDHQALTDWKAKATWFKAKDLIKVLSEIIVDRDANWMARTAAVKSVVAAGADKKDLEKLKKKLDKPEGDDQFVIKELETAIAASN